MFDLPSAKRVRRDELQSPASSPRSSPDPDLTELLRSRAHDEFAFTATESEAAKDEAATAASEDDEAELILFAAPSNAPQSHKIRLSSPGAGTDDPGFVVKKPRSYYFADAITSEKEKELDAVAMTGDAVMDMSREPWPGCALPWKVQMISAAGLKKSVLVGHPPTLVTVEEKVQKRKRKGKKSRIALRKKLQATKEKEAEQARLALEKEETEREKRTRRNREKKVKKKERDKAKKLAGAGHEDPPSPNSDSVD